MYSIAISGVGSIRESSSPTAFGDNYESFLPYEVAFGLHSTTHHVFVHSQTLQMCKCKDVGHLHAPSRSSEPIQELRANS